MMGFNFKKLKVLHEFIPFKKLIKTQISLNT